MLVVERQQRGDIQPLRAVGGAVAAGGAGQRDLPDHAVRDREQGLRLAGVEGLFRLEGVEVFLELREAGHAGEHDRDARERL